MIQKLSVLLLLLALIPLVSACEDRKEVFSGLEGRVGLGPVEGARVRVFDASVFNGFDSTQGLVAESHTNALGGFRIALADALIGRPLLIIADFPADDPMTVEDERARMVHFDNSVTTLEASEAPWVSMLDFFDGLTVNVSVSPLSNAAYESLSHGRSDIVGAGNNRFTDQNIIQTNGGLAASFGLRYDFTGFQPSVLPIASNFPNGGQIDASQSRLLTFVYAQLDQAAQDFANQTTDAGDSALDFFEALARDAADGVLDGRGNGSDILYFASPGAPNVLGHDATGVSRLVTYVESFAPQVATLLNGILAASELSDLRAKQLASRGSAEPMHVESISQRRLAHHARYELEIRGRGFLDTCEIHFGAEEDADFSALGDPFALSKETNNPGIGEILELRHDLIRFRTPDFFAITDSFSPRLSAPVNPFNLFLVNEYEVSGVNKRTLSTRRIAEMENVYSPSLQVSDAKIVRLNATGSQAASAAILGQQVDPDTLDPMNDEVFAFEFSIANGSSTTLENIALDLAASSATRLSGGVVSIGDLAANANLTFPTQVSLDAAGNTLAPMSVMTLRVPFVVNPNQIGAGLDIGNVVHFTPILKSTRQDNAQALASDEETYLVKQSANFTVFSDDATPMPSSASINAPAALASTAQGDVVWTLDLAGRNAMASRAIKIDSIELLGTFNGNDLVSRVWTSTSGLGALDLAGETIGAPELTNSLGASVLGLSASQGPLTFKLSVTHSGSNFGPFSLRLRVNWSEPASGVSGMLEETVVINLN